MNDHHLNLNLGDRMGFIGFTFTERELLLGERTSSPVGLRFNLLLVTEDRTN
jgi:hypothetical protein